MRKFSVTGVPVNTSRMRGDRVGFLIISPGKPEGVRCVFNGHERAFGIISKAESHKDKVRVKGRMTSEVTTSGGDRFKIYYPSEVLYDGQSKKTKEA